MAAELPKMSGLVIISPYNSNGSLSVVIGRENLDLLWSIFLHYGIVDQLVV